MLDSGYWILLQWLQASPAALDLAQRNRLLRRNENQGVLIRIG
jgi:hypothetical protein